MIYLYDTSSNEINKIYKKKNIYIHETFNRLLLLFDTCLQFPTRKSGERICMEIATCLRLYPYLIPDTEVEHLCVTGYFIPRTSILPGVRPQWFLAVPVYIGIAVITVTTTHCTPGKDVQTSLWTGKCPRLLAVSVAHIDDNLVVHYLFVCPLWTAVRQGNCERYVYHHFCNSEVYNSFSRSNGRIYTWIRQKEDDLILMYGETSTFKLTCNHIYRHLFKILPILCTYYSGMLDFICTSFAELWGTGWKKIRNENIWLKCRSNQR